MSEPNTPRLAPPKHPDRPAPDARPARSRPDPNPLRLLLGLAGIASASAITSALLPSVTPRPVIVTEMANVAPAATPTVVHITNYVTLKPGETAPPQASVVIQPTPTPRVTVVTTTRQSGLP